MQKVQEVKLKKPKITKTIIKNVVIELVSEAALPIVQYLQGKNNISEFIIAEELALEIHKTRNSLYKLLEQNIVTFKRKKDNTPYLEVHHKIRLSDGGEDTIDNVVALCPNCHRKAHYGF